jgi:hypothetical protein
MMKMKLLKNYFRLTSVLLAAGFLTSCGDNCEVGCEDVPIEKTYSLVNDLDEVALTTFYGDNTRSSNIVFQINVRANSNIIIYTTVDENIGLLETAPFGEGIAFDSVTIEIAQLEKRIYLNDNCPTTPNPLCESGYSVIETIYEDMTPVELLNFVIQ